MTTIKLDTRYNEARKLIDQLRNARYATILDKEEPNAETLKAISDAEKGNTNKYPSARKMFETLNRKPGV